MRTELHAPCSFASAALHATRIARRTLATYADDMTVFDDTAYARDVGERLRAARTRVSPKITQGQAAEHLANALGYTDGSSPASRVSNYENGHRLPDLITVRILCDLYGCTPSSILSDDATAHTAQEIKLLDMYRQTDERGRRQITRVAESQPMSSTPSVSKAG